jgi:hypothetical protein
MSNTNMPSEFSVVLTASEMRLIRAHRNTDDEVQETTVRMVERYAVHPALMRHKAPTFQLYLVPPIKAPARSTKRKTTRPQSRPEIVGGRHA